MDDGQNDFAIKMLVAMVYKLGGSLVITESDIEEARHGGISVSYDGEDGMLLEFIGEETINKILEEEDGVQ